MKTFREKLIEFIKWYKPQEAIVDGWDDFDYETLVDKYLNEQNNKNKVSYQKAVEYAKVKYDVEYYDSMFERDVQETMNDFQAGFEAAMQKK